MKIDDFVEISYKYGLEQIKENEESWREFLSLSGRIYNFEFNNCVVIYNQNKNSSLLADFDTWNKSGRYVNKGASAIKIYPSRIFTNRSNIRHLFDISQTRGKEIANNWVFTEQLKVEFAKFYTLDESNVDLSIRMFTASLIRDTIIDKYESEYAQYSEVARDFISNSITYLIYNRCRISEEIDLSNITKFNSDNISQFGDIINNVSQEILHDIFEDLRIINDNLSKGRDNYGQGFETGVQIRRGRTWLHDSRISGRAGANELSDQQVGDSLGGLDGRDVSSGFRSSQDVSGIEAESADGRGINLSERGNDEVKVTDAERERNRQDIRLHGTSEAGELREFSGRGNNQKRDNRGQEAVSIETAKRLINEYCVHEYGNLADFSDLQNVGIAYTTKTNEQTGVEYDYQVSVDLINYSISYQIEDLVFNKHTYESLEQLINNELNILDFDLLITEHVPDDIWENLQNRHINDSVDGVRAELIDEEVVEETTSSLDVDSDIKSFDDIKVLHSGDSVIDINGNILSVVDEELPVTRSRNSLLRLFDMNEEPLYIPYYDIREIRFGNGGVYYLSDSEVANMNGIRTLESFILSGKKGYKDNIPGYSYDDIVVNAFNYINKIIEEYAPELDIVDFAINGSRSRGYYNEYSDLDIVLFVKAPTDNYIREDFLFDLLHGVRGSFEEEDEEILAFNGVEVDINPKIVHNYAEIGEYLESAERYMEEAAKEKITSELSDVGISFDKQVDMVLSGTYDRYNDLKVCDTPKILQDVGCDELPMLYSQSHLKRAIEEKDNYRHTHGLKVEQIKKMPQLLADPVMVYDSLSRDDSIVVLTDEIDDNNLPIVISIKLNGKGMFELTQLDSNYVTSMYGRNNFEIHLDRLIQKDKILFANKEKSQELLRVLSLQWSQGVSSLNFDSIIHQSRNITSGKTTSEQIKEVLPKIEEVSDASEPTANESFHQASLFDEDFWMGYISAGESSVPKVDFSSNLISDESIDEIIKTDGWRATSYYKWWGRVGIYEKYREGASPEEVADYLKNEYGKVSKGFTFNGTKISMYTDDTGMTLGIGESAKDGFVKKLSWEEVETRTRRLVESGEYMNISEIELVDGFVREGIAETMEFLFRDLEDDYPDSILSGHTPGFPDNVSEIKELLKSKDYISTVIKEAQKVLDGEYTPRFKGLATRQAKGLIYDLSFYQRDKLEFIKKNDVVLISETFITQDLIDMTLKRGSNISQSKMRIYEWFQTEHPLKDSVKFLRHEYGIGGSGGDYWIDYDSRGIKITRGHILGDNVSKQLDYSAITKRIKHLIKRDEYLNDKEKIAYKEKMAARVAFFDGLKVGNIYRNPNAYNDDTYSWVLEIDYDSKTFKYINIYLTDDYAFDSDTNERVVRRICESDFNYFPDFNYEFTKTIDDLGDFELIPNTDSYGSEYYSVIPRSKSISSEELVVDNDQSDFAQGFEQDIKQDNTDIYNDANEQEPSENKLESNNYRIDLNNLPDSLGSKGRFKRNIDAIKTLKAVEAEQRPATLEEQRVMSLYVGWGGLSEAFDPNNDNWLNEYRELKSLLNDTEYSSARASVNTAFYTDPAIIKAVNDAIKEMGFKGGNILEPSCAIGNFIGTLDEDIINNSNVFGVEIDDVSGRIAKLLYPKADISICGFEDTQFSDNYFDLAIGNVPFGQYKVFDKDYRDLNFNIHDYFFAKTLDKVRPGGIIAFITTIGTLDKKSDVVRKYIGERAELLGAIRLPDIVFKDNAGTKAASDIIFLQKRKYRTIEEPEWLDILPNEDDILINKYYIDNPDMMLGKMVIDNRFGDRSFNTCVSKENSNLLSELSNAIKSLPSDIYIDSYIESESEIREDVIPADPEVRNYTFTIVGDDVYFRTDSVMTKSDLKGRDKDRVKACIQISEYVRKVMNIQLNGCTDDELNTALDGLNAAYDTFVSEYGFFHDRKNHSLFSDDDNYNILESLEIENEDGKSFSKAPFFSERTIKVAETVDSVDNAVDALKCSINETGRVDLPYMASIFTKDVDILRRDLLSKEVNITESYSDEEIRMTALIEELKGIIFLNPERYDENNIYAAYETADEYLSGNVRGKLELAKEYADKYPELFTINVQALSEVIPEWVEASNIEVRLGTTWIDDSDYEQFIYDTFDVSSWARRTTYGSNNNKVIIECEQGEYHIGAKSSCYSEKNISTFGTDRMSGLDITERLLNLNIITVYDYYDDGAKRKRVINPKETMLARDKAELIKQEFKDWIFATPERREKYEKYYNENFNNTHLRTYNGEYLTFPGMTPTIELRPHQKNAVAHILLGGNTLLAHCVGAGKSFEMFAAVMEQRRLGLANKPVIVVPKSIINQTANEFMRLYPTANLLVANTKNFAKKDRMRFLTRASTGDYDCIIMSHEQFKEIPISKERMLTLLNKEYDTYTEMLQRLAEKDRSGEGKRWSIKKIERSRHNIETRIKKTEEEINDGKIDLFTFEEVGIDSIFVDEAHNYKNRSIVTKMSNISGISSSSSVMAEDMYYKTQYLNEMHRGRGVVFATGTPISNSMCEMFVMQTFLQNDILVNKGVAAFDNWATSFGEVTQSLDLSVEGNGYRLRNKFNKFVNVPELLNMFHEFADVQTAEMLNLPDVPKMRGGKAIIVESQVDEFTKMYMDSIVARAEALRNKQVSDPRVDNFLKITGEARLLGTDARLLDASAPDNPDGKLNKAAQNIYNEYLKSNKDGNIGTQLVFSDIGTPSPDRFNVYDELKNKLIGLGIPEEEIAFIHDAKTDVQRQKLFDKTQRGAVKVLFGSTSKLGTGVNVQNHLVALHHLDCPWRPSDIEQREGRGLRQGNENSEVAIYRYVTVGTFDAYLWSVVENKQKFINQIMRGSITNRSMSDIDDTELGFAEIKAVASGNPKIKRKMELDMELSKLTMLKNNWQKNKYSLQDKYLKEYPRDIKRYKEQIENIKKDIITRDNELLKNPDFEITICGTGEVFNERKAAGEKILTLARAVVYDGEKRYIANYKGFEVYAVCRITGTGLYRNLLIQGESSMTTDKFSSDYVGIITQIENRVKGLEKNLEVAESSLEISIKNKEQAEIDYNKPFEHEEHLIAVKKELNEINSELDLDNVQGDQAFAVDENSNTSLDQEENVDRKQAI